MNLIWKENWPETRQRFMDWWKREGFLIGHWGSGLDTGGSLYGIEPPSPPVSEQQRHTDAEWIVQSEEYRLSRNWQGADFLPIVFPDYGTVTLATFLGAEPVYEKEYILYRPSGLSPENDRPLDFDPENPMFQQMMRICTSLKERSQDRFAVGMPALPPGLDVLAELRGTQDLLMDLILNPEWVKEKLEEIDSMFFDCYERFYEVLKGKDGSSMFGWFMFWGPGRVSLAQCDFCAMISPEMFREFGIPSLRRQCDRIEYTLFHLDGPDAINKLDAVLEVESLKAVEFTPGPQVPPGGDPRWFEMYRRIKAAGKAVQAVWIKPEEVVPLFDEVGPEGMYLEVEFETREQVEKVLKDVEQFRKSS